MLFSIAAYKKMGKCYKFHHFKMQIYNTNMIENLFYLKILVVDELSVSPSYVLKLRKQISTIDTSKVDINEFINSSK